MLELSLLGGFDVRTARGQSVALPTRKARALLAYLALHPDQAVSRESLTALLWSDRAEPQANNSLSQAVTAIRKALAGVDPAPLVVEPDSLKLVGDTAEVDALAFVELAKSADPAALDRAERLYRGAFLDGIGVRDPVFEDWLEVERRRLHALAVGALTRLLDVRRHQGQRHELVATAQRLLKLDPLQEAAYRALMRCYGEQGQIGLALSQYEACADVLKRELGVAPDRETQRIRDAILRRRPASPAASPAAAPAAGPAVAPAAGKTPAPATGGPSTEPRAGVRRLWRPAAMLLLLVGGGMAFYGTLRDPLPQRPAIVVLPFSGISGAPEQESFADGVTEDLITGLSKVPGLFVISRNTSMAYKGRNARPREVARDLDVRYVLEGSVRRADDRLRINARLTDAASEENIWADSYDGTTADVFALQDKITESIVAALSLELLPPETRRAGRTGTEDVDALDAFNMGRFHYYRRTPEDNARAAVYFERAIGRDPGYAAAHTALAKVYVQAALGEQAYADALGIFWAEGYTRAARMLDKAIARPSADARVLHSWLALRKHQHDRAVSEAEAALALNPNDAEALEALAEALIYSGRPQDGIIQAQKAMAQNPLLLGRPLYLIGLAEFALGHSDRAIERLARAIELAPAHEPEFSGLLAAAYGALGRAAEAAAAFAVYQEGLLDRPALAWSVAPQPFANPRSHTWWRVDLAWAVYAHPFASRDVLERLAEGLKVAGATSGIGGFLPLHAGNRLSGNEIRALLFGASIGGKGFQPGETQWRQDRAADGVVRHRGYPLHPGLARAATGTGRIAGDRLCDRWPGPGLGPGLGRGVALETCVAIYRIADPKARLRWGDYVMVTDTGPHPFSPIE